MAANDSLRTAVAGRIDPLCQRFEDAWRRGDRPRIEDFLPHASATDQKALLRELVHIEIAYRRQRGERPKADEYAARFAAHDAAESAEPLTVEGDLLAIATADVADTPKDAAEIPLSSEVPRTQPRQAGIEFSISTSFESRDDTNEFREAPAAALADLPQIPNYEIQSVLGRGGMGVVLKARHRVLGRTVAIKLPLVGQFGGADERERFLREARAAARLHHRQICPIHEVGQIEGRPYLVLQFLAGKTLHEWSAERKPSARDSASLLARVARAVG